MKCCDKAQNEIRVPTGNGVDLWCAGCGTRIGHKSSCAAGPCSHPGERVVSYKDTMNGTEARYTCRRCGEHIASHNLKSGGTAEPDKAVEAEDKMKGEYPRFMKCQTCGNIINREKGCYLCPKPSPQRKRAHGMIGTEPWGPEDPRKVVWRDIIAE